MTFNAIELFEISYFSAAKEVDHLTISIWKHVSVLSNVTTDALMLKHQATSNHSTLPVMHCIWPSLKNNTVSLVNNIWKWIKFKKEQLFKGR